MVFTASALFTAVLDGTELRVMQKRHHGVVLRTPESLPISKAQEMHIYGHTNHLHPALLPTQALKYGPRLDKDKKKKKEGGGGGGQPSTFSARRGYQ